FAVTGAAVPRSGFSSARSSRLVRDDNAHHTPRHRRPATTRIFALNPGFSVEFARIAGRTAPVRSLQLASNSARQRGEPGQLTLGQEVAHACAPRPRRVGSGVSDVPLS